MLTKEKRWLGALLALCMAAGLIPAAAAEAEPVSGTVARGVYLDAAGNSQSYEVAFDTPLPSDGCELATGSYYLTEDLDLTTDFTVADNAVVKLDLAGHILRGTGKVAVITVGDNACLEVYDSDANEDNPTPTTHYYTEDENSVWVFDDANPSGTPWTGGVITGGGRAEGLSSSIPSHGGLYARYTNYDPATSPVAISLFSGSICGNRLITSRTGAGITADNAKVFVAGGSICGNQKGLCVEAPFFILTGGLLQGDSSYERYPARSIDIDEARVTVDGVTKKYPGTMVMYGGTVRNATIRIGGSIPVRPCRFTMYGGEITGTVDSHDNYIDYLVGLEDSTFEMYGGSIHDACADYIISMDSNVIPENSTPGEEGGCTFLLDGGVITNNAFRDSLIRAAAKEKNIIRSGRITDNTPSRNIKAGTIVLTGTRYQGDNVGFGSCVIEGGEISGNDYPGVKAHESCSLSLSGAVKLTGNSQGDICLMDGCKAIIAGPLSNTEKISVYMDPVGVFTSGWSAQMGSADPADYFTSAMEGYEVKAQSVDGAVEAALVAVSAPVVTHTATFVVGDEVIDRVVFEEGAATLAEPALPQRANYVGRWERYNLAAATGDITVHGLYTPLDPDAVSNVDAGVTATYDKSEVTIDLFARADSRTVKVVSQQTKPVDVVLVLDQSGSMKDSLSARDRQSKRDALVSCANAFVQSLYENAVASGADHRVAVVGFAYSSYNGGNYKNTGLLATPSGQSVNYARLKESDYRSALLPVNDGGHINANVVSGINAIRADGATAADLGLKMARDIFSANPTQGERERIVIFITDGTPTSWGEEPARVRPTAATAISVASTIKNAQGAKIYSVGVHANADPSAAFTEAPDGITTNRNGTFVSYDFNRFLHAVSSNYPSAAAMDALGDGDKNGGFYMGVRDTENLDKIFTNILYSTVYQLKTFDKATLYYTLTPEFTLTTEQELAMRQALAAQGLTDADIQVIRNADSTTSLRFQNVKVREVYGEDGKLHYEAAVRFQVSANQTDALPDPSLASWTISEATFSPAHTHSFAPAYQTGSCREGLTSVYRCACGETRSETAQPAEHDFVAVLADNGGVGAEVERVVCTKCGHSEEQHINFKVSYSSARKTTVLDLNLLQNDVDVVQPTEDIELRFFVGEDGGKLYTVTRIDPDGQRTTYQTRAEGGYLVFRADHFSIYVLSELDETTAQPVEAVSYEQAVELLDSKTVSAPTAPLEGAGTGGTGIGGVQIANDTLSAMIDLADGLDGAAAFLAVYTQGRMTGVQRTALAPGRQSVSFSIPEGADRVKLFVLSGDSAPLCGAYQLEP